MIRTNRIALSLLMAVPVWAADFQTGQAARAVIGQSSFSSLEAGITPTALALGSGRLYAADASRRLLTYDLTQIPGAKDDLASYAGSSCSLCGFSPIASIPQTVVPGVAAVSGFGKTVAIADTAGRRVLIWRDTSSPRAVRGPDIVLGRNGSDTPAISGSTLIDPISVAFDGKRLFVGDGALHRVLVWNSLPAFDNQPADLVLGQQSLGSGNMPAQPGSDTIGRPAALVSDGTNLFVADTVEHRILVFTAADRPLPNNSVVNSASLIPGAVAPGTLVTISGRGLSDVTESAPEQSDDPLPDRLAGVEVLLNGVAAPLLSVSPEQIRAQLPYDFAGPSSASLYIRTQHLDESVTTTTATPLMMLPATPGLMAFGGPEPRIGMVLHTDPGTEQASAPVTADAPAMPGDVLVVWASGLGAVDTGEEGNVIAGTPYSGPDASVLNPVEAWVGGRTAQVLSATLPHGAIGIYEVRIQLPADLANDPNTPITISQNGESSNTVTISVQSAGH